MLYLHLNKKIELLNRKMIAWFFMWNDTTSPFSVLKFMTWVSFTSVKVTEAHFSVYERYYCSYGCAIIVWYKDTVSLKNLKEKQFVFKKVFLICLVNVTRWTLLMVVGFRLADSTICFTEIWKIKGQMRMTSLNLRFSLWSLLKFRATPETSR